eukprot:1296937-Pleurochrysis_carterae.AAC.4
MSLSTPLPSKSPTQEAVNSVHVYVYTDLVGSRFKKWLMLYLDCVQRGCSRFFGIERGIEAQLNAGIPRPQSKQVMPQSFLMPLFYHSDAQAGLICSFSSDC